MSDAAVLGVRFGPAGRVVFFTAADTSIAVGDQVVVPTPQGPAVARVVVAPHQILRLDIADPLPAVIRRVEAPEQ